MALVAASSPFIINAQEKYSDFAMLTFRIKMLAKEFPELCTVSSLVKTAGGKDIWLITAGTGNKDSKPGVVIVGGLEGNHLLGSELAAGFAEKLLKNSWLPEIKNLLEKITFYVLPNVSPDATEQYFASVRYERSVNSRPYDNDRDFLTDEDPCEDINGDGMITLMRVADPSGTYTQSRDDKRVMVKADLSKGETGTYLVYSEGTDNDKDEVFNEDGEGGVNFNNNLTYNYEEFGNSSGPYPVSEPETKAVMDFFFDRFNVFAVFAFGPQDNLCQPMKSADHKEGERDVKDPTSDERPYRRRVIPTTAILKSDELINKFVSSKYHEITGVKVSPPAVSEPGNFMEWAYFHYGRYSFSTPGWWYPVEKDENRETAFLKFAEKNKLKDVFIPWTKTEHPDFPGKIVEIGGIKPFVMVNPPADTLGDLVESHYKFITAVSALHPELEFLDTRVEKTEDNIFRLSLKVHNKGVFATSSEMGDSNLWTRIMRIEVILSKNQNLISGTRIARINRLQGDEIAEFGWLISGKGSVNVIAGAENTGKISTSLFLK